MATDLQTIYATRFPEAERIEKDRIWQTLCTEFFQRYIPKDATVLDLAAGYCEFINHIHAGRKIAVDLNPETAMFAAPDVEFVLEPSDHMRSISDGTVDRVFVSNFFEHLPSTEAFLDTLQEIRRVLRIGGRILILQPNIRYLNGKYWDFLDHSLALTDRRLVEALELTGFTPREVRPQFLPYTTKSRFPKASFLISWYVRFPLVWRVLGKQAWVVAERVS